MNGIDPLLLERAARVRLLALDVDGVLTDGRLYFDASGRELKVFHTRDGLGLKAVQRAGIELAFISGRAADVVVQRAEALGVRHLYLGSDEKLDAFDDLLARTGLDAAQVCYAGDDWIDLPLLRRAGLAVTVPEADAVVRDAAHWVTSRGGGLGAVREICDLLLQAQGHWDALIARYRDR